MPRQTRGDLIWSEVRQATQVGVTASIVDATGDELNLPVTVGQAQEGLAIFNANIGTLEIVAQEAVDANAALDIRVTAVEARLDLIEADIVAIKAFVGMP